MALVLIEHRARGVKNAGVRQGFINRAAKSKNSASPGSNKGRAPKWLVVHPDDLPSTNDPQKWLEASIKVQSHTKTAKSKTTGRVVIIGGASVPGSVSV